MCTPVYVKAHFNGGASDPFAAPPRETARFKKLQKEGPIYTLWTGGQGPVRFKARGFAQPAREFPCSCLFPVALLIMMKLRIRDSSGMLAFATGQMKWL
jgi:hypothetical protein